MAPKRTRHARRESHGTSRSRMASSLPLRTVTWHVQRFRGGLATIGSRLELGSLVLDALRGISTPLRAAAVEINHLEPDPATLASRAAFAREGIVCVAIPVLLR
jgi:hypothetical protein